MPFSFGLSRRTARLIFLLRSWANRTRGKHEGNFLIDKAVMRVMQTYKCICFLSWRAWTIKILTLLPLISSSVHATDLRPGDIVTVLTKDATPAIMSPSFDDVTRLLGYAEPIPWWVSRSPAKAALTLSLS